MSDLLNRIADEPGLIFFQEPMIFLNMVGFSEPPATRKIKDCLDQFGQRSLLVKQLQSGMAMFRTSSVIHQASTEDYTTGGIKYQ